MKAIILLGVLSLCMTFAMAQEVKEQEPPQKTEEVELAVVDQNPEPVKGMDAFYQYIATNLKYPKEARMAHAKGKVHVKFTVQKDGSLANYKIIQSVGYGCDEEAIRVLKEAGKWKPAMYQGKPMAIDLVLPFDFSFTDEQIQVDE